MKRRTVLKPAFVEVLAEWVDPGIPNLPLGPERVIGEPVGLEVLNERVPSSGVLVAEMSAAHASL